jgi:hypothetical protein
MSVARLEGNTWAKSGARERAIEEVAGFVSGVHRQRKSLALSPGRLPAFIKVESGARKLFLENAPLASDLTAASGIGHFLQ